MRTFLSIAILALALVMPTATAGPSDLASETFCILIWVVAEEPAEPCADPLAVDVGGDMYYVALGPGGFYHESNGCAGLQQAASDCDGDGDVEPRDHYVHVDDYA